ncbi:hypothetical protein PVAG01_01922 [Phlyctema vagabunda]|uniref:Glycosyltransferase family 1 protein n=1 Tax=Phlyctema vagabunda TaxID=108571 RepID=A0ABR4PYG2_9HELO
MIISPSTRRLLPKRQVHFLTLILTVAVFSLFQYLLFNRPSTFVGNADRYLFSSHRKLRIAVVNTQLSHDEVLVPLLDSWLQVPQAEVTTYQVGFRFGMEQVISDSGLAEEIKDHIYAGEFRKIGKDPRFPIPDIVVSTTCLKDGKHLNETLYYLLENHHTHFFCVFHHADQMENRKNAMVIDQFTPFVRAGRIDFMALSPHVAEFAKNDQFGRKWNVVKNELHHPPVHVFPPVFNFKSVADGQRSQSGREGGFALQGEYEKGRDYPMVFKHLQKFIKAAEARQESADGTNLHLVGFGKHPEVPKNLQTHVIFDERLDYTDFYTTLRQSEAVVTAFKLESYYLTKASSTVPAALIAGTPIVGDRRLLRTYQYLDESIIWLQEEGESEMDTVGRVFAMSQSVKDAKKAAVLKWTESMVLQNHKNVREWAAQAVSKFPANWYMS